jgi:hypothetical protein
VLDFNVVFPAILLVLSCSVCLRLAIAAGRAESGSWTWGLCLFSEILLIGGSVAAAGWVVLTIGEPYSSGIGFVVTLILGFVLALVLVSLEYVATRRKDRLAADLRGSLWPTRIGFKKL